MAKVDKPVTVAVETHGCKLNQADSLVLSKEFQVAGFSIVPAYSPSDVYVVNTCTVTHVAAVSYTHLTLPPINSV